MTKLKAILSSLILVASVLAVSPVAHADPAPANNITVSTIAAGGGFTGGTMTAGPNGIVGDADDGDAHGTGFGGIIRSTIANETISGTTVDLYCIDLLTGIGFTDETWVGTWETAAGTLPTNGNTNTLTAENIPKIASIVANNYPNEDSLVPLAGTDNDKALAVQWAIWHYANGYEPGTALASLNFGSLGVYTTTPATVLSNYDAILAAVEANTYPEVPEPELPYLDLLAPASIVGVPNQPVGPYTIDATSGTDVYATATNGATIVDANGVEVTGPFADGDQLYISGESIGSSTISISASIVLPIGATMVNPEKQRLVNTTEVLSNYQAAEAASFVEPASVGNYVWHDTNADGIQDEGEPAVQDVEVTLLDSDSTVLATATTDEDGYYIFEELAPGDYTVVFTEPEGFTTTSTDAGDDESLDSDGLSVEVSLVEGQQDLSIDLGLVTTKEIFGVVYHDVNGNGTQDEGEPGLPGIEVEVVDDEGNVLEVLTTNENGEYETTLTTEAQVSTEVNNPESFVGDGNGLYQTVRVGDYIFLDTNNDGFQDATDVALANVTVELLGDDGSVISTTTTDENGQYFFDGLAPGTYTVEAITPAGLEATQANQGDRGNDSSTGTATSLTLASGEEDLTLDFGFIDPSTVNSNAAANTQTTTGNTTPTNTQAAAPAQLAATGSSTTVLTLAALLMLTTGLWMSRTSRLKEA